MRARVWNDHTLPVDEIFKGEKLHIDPGKFIEMEFYDAHQFKGQYRPIIADASGKFGTPESYKIVRVEKIEDNEPADVVEAYSCMSCGKSYESEHVLKAHSESAHAAQEKIVIPEVDREVAAKKRGRPAKAEAQKSA